MQDLTQYAKTVLSNPNTTSGIANIGNFRYRMTLTTIIEHTVPHTLLSPTEYSTVTTAKGTFQVPSVQKVVATTAWNIDSVPDNVANELRNYFDRKMDSQYGVIKP